MTWTARLLATLVLLAATQAEAAMFGLSWGADQASVKARFEGIAPSEEREHVLIYPLGAVAEKLWNEGAFCPTAICSGPGRANDTVVLNFQNGQLAAGFVSFGYAYEMIGLKSENLSEQAMTAFARTELQQLIHELSARYGAPQLFTESNMRSGTMNPVGAALFHSPQSGSVHLMFGHDGAGFTGELRYQSPAGSEDGF